VHRREAREQPVLDVERDAHVVHRHLEVLRERGEGGVADAVTSMGVAHAVARVLARPVRDLTEVLVQEPLEALHVGLREERPRDRVSGGPADPRRPRARERAHARGDRSDPASHPRPHAQNPACTFK
jgi:hypothetical protein